MSENSNEALAVSYWAYQAVDFQDQLPRHEFMIEYDSLMSGYSSAHPVDSKKLMPFQESLAGQQ